MLRIFAAFGGPIFAKEMVEMARRRRYFLTRVFYGLALLVALFAVWQDYRYYLRTGMTIAVMARMAESLFYAVSSVQFGAVFLFVPLFVCGVIAGEREERTLELLFTTQLSDREIVLGKLGSRVAALVCLILCGLPVISLIMLFGGIDPVALGRSLAVTLLAVLYAGAHAIYFSAVTRSPLGALVRTYWWMAVWLLGVPGAVGLFLEVIDASPAAFDWMAVLLFVNPIGSFALALNGAAYTATAAFVGTWFYPFTFVAPAAWSLLLIGLAVRRLRGEPVPFARWAARVPLVGSFAEVLRHSADRRAQRRRAWDAEWTLRGNPVGNPLWLRARRARVYDREGHVGRIQWGGWAAALFFLVLVAAADGIDDEECSMSFLSVTWIALVALAALVAGTSLVGDRRRGFLELVLVTPLTRREFIDGTLLAVWEHLRRLYWLPWVLGLIFCIAGASLLHGLLFSLLTGTLFLVLLALYGVACSLAARTLAGALVSTFLFPLIALGGTGLLIAIFEDNHGPVLWALCLVFLAGSWLWVRRQMNAASVGCFLTAVHLALGVVATAWTYDGRKDAFPAALMNAGFMTITTLDDRTDNWFDQDGYWMTMPCYWAVLVVNILWARWWIIRHFDPLADRAGPRQVGRREGTTEHTKSTKEDRHKKRERPKEQTAQQAF